MSPIRVPAADATDESPASLHREAILTEWATMQSDSSEPKLKLNKETLRRLDGEGAAPRGGAPAAKPWTRGCLTWVHCPSKRWSTCRTCCCCYYV